MANKTFNGKVVWVIGASSGIGEQLCYELARQGAKLIISARNEEKLEKVNSHLATGTKILQLDLEQSDSLPIKVEEALSAFGKIDYLFNNAGLSIKDFVINTKMEIDRKIMEINYFGQITITKLLLPHFLERNEGYIVVTGSLSGKYGVPKISSYAASKHALHGFYETLRSEIASENIFITIIIPGIIKTEITAHALTGDGSAFGKVEKTFQTAYPADKAARKILKAVKSKKEEAFVGGSERITLWLNRISPWLLRRFIISHPIKKMRKLKSLFGRR